MYPSKFNIKISDDKKKKKKIRELPNQKATYATRGSAYNIRSVWGSAFSTASNEKLTRVVSVPIVSFILVGARSETAWNRRALQLRSPSQRNPFAERETLLTFLIPTTHESVRSDFHFLTLLTLHANKLSSFYNTQIFFINILLLLLFYFFLNCKYQ